jgi:chromate transport protein ChrA
MEPFPEAVEPKKKYNPLAILSFVLGLVASIFPIVSFYYLIAENGGAGYVQSLFCGVPLTFASIILGIVSLVQISRKNQPGTAQAAVKGAWMAIVGIVYGILVFGLDCIMLAGLILPYLSGLAQ